MTELVTVTLIALATARITRFLTTDKITESPRRKLQFAFEDRWERRTGKTSEQWGSKVAYLVGCDWCTSIYTAAITTAATAQVTSVPLPVLTALTASLVTGLLALRS